jgi:luciferase family oxidoreductase group 1
VFRAPNTPRRDLHRCATFFHAALLAEKTLYDGQAISRVRLRGGSAMQERNMTLPLSVLDLVPISEGVSSTETLRQSLDLAKAVDRLGYTRLWYAEHHNMPSIASTTPAISIARAGDATRGIRVGSGGVMLPNHAPLQVAESFKMLEGMHPGRVDLGIGRAPGTDPAAALALRGARSNLGAEDFPDRLEELMALAEPGGHPTLPIAAFPADVTLPPIWLLGSSGFSSVLAARLGLGFGFAAHFSPDRPDRPMLAYREQFQPSASFAKPHAILTVSVLCAESEAEAERLATSMQLAWVRLRAGRPSQIPSPESALSYEYSHEERVVARSYRQMQILGTKDSVRTRIQILAERTQADEIMVTTVTHSFQARLESYRLLAEAFELTPRSLD